MRWFIHFKSSLISVSLTVNCYEFLAIFIENTSKDYVCFPILFFTCLISMNFFNVRLLSTSVCFSSKYWVKGIQNLYHYVIYFLWCRTTLGAWFCLWISENRWQRSWTGFANTSKYFFIASIVQVMLLHSLNMIYSSAS